MNCSTTTNWNNLPNEIKIEIVKNLDFSTRLSLRMCSNIDLKLVNAVPFKMIRHLRLSENRNRFQIYASEQYYSSTVYLFEDFDKFQEKLVRILENVNYIKELAIFMENTTKKIKLIKRKVEVCRLHLRVNDVDGLLKQLDTSTLKFLGLNLIGIQTTTNVFDMSLLNTVDELNIFSYDIIYEQLLKIKSKRISLANFGSLTTSGICKFIQSRTSDPMFEQLRILRLGKGQFDELMVELFNSKNPESTTHPSFPDFEIKAHLFCCDFDMFRIRADFPAHASFSLEKVDRVRVDLVNGDYKLNIYQEGKETQEWSTWILDDFQEILAKQMETIRYIKLLEVTHKRVTSGLRFIPLGSSKLLTVVHLKVKVSCWKRKNYRNGQTVVDLLEQFEPRNLKCIDLHGEHICNDVYDTKQVIQADFLEIPNSNILDNQLFKISATKMNFGNIEDGITEKERITPSGTNEFVKKCLLDLKYKNYDFQLILSSHEGDYKQFVSKILEGLQIFSVKNDQKIHEEYYFSEVILNSSWDDIKLKLFFDGRFVKGKRIEV